VVHHFNADRAGQHRGGAGVLAPVLERLRMLIKYDGAELDSAVINAIFAAYISSPFDQELVGSALGNQTELGGYQSLRSEFHDGRNLSLGGARIPILFPGEDIKTVTPTRPNSAFEQFESAVLRNVAAAAGMSYEQVSQNWSNTNYSSARAALLEAWKTMSRRRADFASGFGQGIYSAFVEESMDVDDIPMPKGAPEYSEMRQAYSTCMWIGPGRGWIDPVKERQGAVLGMEAGLSTLEQEAAESSGMDYEEVLDQRQIEIQAFKARGIPLPSWAIETDESVVSERIG
jgi:lambda family phage portal protein